MRVPSDMPTRHRPGSGRGRTVVVVVAVAAFVVFTSLRGIAGFYTDYLWFESVGRTDVWSGVLGTKLLLGGLFTAAFFVLLLANLVLADRIAPAFRPMNVDDELLRRYQDVMDRRAGLVRAGVALVCAVLAGAGMSAQWQEWLLFTNGVTVGETDPQFGEDLGFYLFRLPFLTLAIDWVFASLVVVTLVVAISHYLNGGIRLQAALERVTPQVKAHLSVLLGLLALVKAGDYWLDRYHLVFSSRGAVDGAAYTDVNAELPALELLMAIAVFSAVLFVANIRRRGWVLPVVAVGLWAFVEVVAGTAYPAFVQRFQVLPAQSSKEAPYVQRNITATRTALGMDDIERREFAYDPSAAAAAAAVRANSETLRNTNLLDPDVVTSAFRKLQQGRGYLAVPDVDVDRYPIRDAGGELVTTQAVIAARELNPSAVPGGSWENQHLVYTHGYGAVLSAANGTTSSGQPDFLVRDIPVDVRDGAVGVTVERPELYIGETMSGYAIVGTERNEASYLGDGEQAATRYEGAGGVPIGSFVRRAAFALRFGDWSPLISDFVTGESRIIFVRDVRERVEMLAPFLAFDSDPYLVAADGRLYYIVDAYTTSDFYPYAQRASSDGLSASSGLRRDFRYLRNSVKAVVDAYDGTVTFYVMDPDDQILQVWQRAFPDLFVDSAAMSAELRDHVRYPQDLFRVQTAMWGRYHIDDPAEFLEQTNGWDVAQDPGVVPGQQTQGREVQNLATGERTRIPAERMAPYYQIVRLPGQAEASFVLLRSFVPRSTDESSQQLTGFLAARSDPDGYGELVSYEIPGNVQVDGPLQAAATIESNDEISRNISLLNPQGQGSRVLFGAMLLLPMDDTLLYVRPLFVASEGNELPELKYVIVAHGDTVVMKPTLKDAIAELFGVEIETLENTLPVLSETGGAGGPDDDEGPASGSTTTTTTVADTTDTSDPESDGSSTTSTTTGEPSEPGSIAAELEQVQRLLDEAELALRDDGDLGAYQERVRDARERLAALTERVRVTTTTAVTTTVTAGSA